MIYIKMHPTISITKLNLKCGFLIINNIHEKISRLWLAKRNAVFW